MVPGGATGTAWYYVELGYYKAFMPVYIDKSGGLVGCHHSGTDERKNKQTNEER